MKETKEKNYTYILLCNDNSLYTGWTNNIKERLVAHNNGTGAKYTRGRTPARLVYLEVWETKSMAMKREAAIKKLSRLEKETLINGSDLSLFLHQNGILIEEEYWTIL